MSKVNVISKGRSGFSTSDLISKSALSTKPSCGAGELRKETKEETKNIITLCERLSLNLPLDL